MNRVPGPVLILQRWDPGKRAVRGGVALEFPAVPEKDHPTATRDPPRPPKSWSDSQGPDNPFLTSS